MNTINKILLVGLAIILTAIFFSWLGDRDKKLATWAEAYERCVCYELETTPSNYYVRYGEYPQCNAAPYMNWKPTRFLPCEAELNK